MQHVQYSMFNVHNHKRNATDQKATTKFKKSKEIKFMGLSLSLSLFASSLDFDFQISGSQIDGSHENCYYFIDFAKMKA